MTGWFDPLSRLNGRFKWAIFIAFILSAAFTYVLFIDRDGHTKLEDLAPIIENQKFILKNQEIVFHQWEKSHPGVLQDTGLLFEAFRSKQAAIDTLLITMGKK